MLCRYNFRIYLPVIMTSRTILYALSSCSEHEKLARKSARAFSFCWSLPSKKLTFLCQLLVGHQIFERNEFWIFIQLTSRTSEFNRAQNRLPESGTYVMLMSWMYFSFALLLSITTISTARYSCVVRIDRPTGSRWCASAHDWYAMLRGQWPCKS